MSDEFFSPGREHVLPPSSGVTNQPPPRPVPSVSVAKRRHWGVWIGVLIVLFVAVSGGVYWWLHRPVDWPAVYGAHNRAIAVMDQFKYGDAIDEFEQVIRLAPDWLPARINLGIALLNAGGDDPSKLPRCKSVFEEVLKRDPDNPYAHFCLGILLRHQKDGQEATKHFEAVLQKDPDDAYSWYWLGTLKAPNSPEQTDCYRQALKRNRHLSGALYGLSMNLRTEDPDRAMQLLDESEQLKRIDWGDSRPLVKYSLMGTYADAIGRATEPQPARHVGPLPLFERQKSFTVKLAADASWAKATDFGKDAAGEVRRLIRSRFGATMIALDYNLDGKVDLFLASAVIEKGQVRDLLLRNDGDGRFTDVTAEAGLAEPRLTLGCCAADFDNDGHSDLLLTGIGMQKLFRNTGGGKFEDVTAKATLNKLTSVCLTAAFIDLDQDSDLDIVFCEFAATAEDAVKLLNGEKSKPGGLIVYLHEGEAPGVLSLAKKEPPLDCKFEAKNIPSLQGPPTPIVGLAASDLDNDRDLDLLLLTDGAAPAVAVNDRLLRFRRTTLPDNLLAAAHWNGALVLDTDHDGRSDLLSLSTDKAPQLLRNRHQRGMESSSDWFELSATNAPPLRQAVAIDLNLDSWTDVVGLSREGIPVLLYNQGGRLVREPDAFGRDDDWPRDLVALIVCDANGDANPDLFVWSENQGLQLYANRGNGGNGVQVELHGRNAVDVFYHMRCNADGIGAWVQAQSGDLWAGQENTTLCAGLGQSRQPLVFGLAHYPRVEVLLLRWPDGSLQAEPDVRAGQELLAGHLHSISQRNRIQGSCPILFAWDGRRFVFVNDFLGAGSIGETGPDGSCRPPRPEESVAIETEQLAVRNGEYVLKITEPMDETTYLDRLQLVVVDRPPGVRVYPEERFVTAGPAPSQQLVAFSKEIFPVVARDHRGRDVTETLRHWDRVAVDDFAKRAWIGFAEEHAVELDFGDRLASFGPKDRLYLCLAGWTEYPFPESSWAAHQAGVQEQWPILERQDESGEWHSLGESGFPAGTPRMMLVDVTGKLTGPRCRLRLRTNMHICWDQAFVAADCRGVGEPLPNGRDSARATTLEVHQATLAPGRIPAEYSPDGRLPKLYDHDRADNVMLVGQSGRMTRFGDVTELLHKRDDRFVIFGPGDDLTVRFDAASLPPLLPGWKRSFVLRTAGYCKDTALSTAHGETVEPLPFAAMRNYPYGPERQYPNDALHRDYLRNYLTREVTANPWPRREQHR
ncbi:MAG TPA: FG-GAP-like repeat-containing protein [Gemmataceae bacterium]|nr:FG-GAP-like repeat-containing protein [Gemmataceae bacterium]